MDAILKNPLLEGAQVSIEVRALKEGRLIVSKNPDLVLNPASNIKLVTMAAALHELGPEFRLATQVFIPAGDDPAHPRKLWVKGFGDPFFVSEELQKLILSLKEKGVSEVRGDLILDTSVFDEKSIVSYQGINSPNDYVVTGPLSFNFNRNYHYILKKKLTLQEVIDQPQMTRIKKSDLRKNPALMWGKAFKKGLEEYGIPVKGQVDLGRLPSEAVLLAEHLSPPLSELILGLGKYSNNFTAEQVAKVLGSRKTGSAGSTEEGLQVLRNYLSKAGIQNETYSLMSASGLSRGNRFSAHQFVSLLATVYQDEKIRSAFVEALSLAGVDGTLKARFLSSPQKGKLRAKTGSLYQVSSLSGYLFKKGEVYAFSILINDFKPDLSAAENIQERLIDLIDKNL